MSLKVGLQRRHYTVRPTSHYLQRPCK